MQRGAFPHLFPVAGLPTCCRVINKRQTNINTKGEWWNNSVEEASQGNRELLMVLKSFLGYMEQKENHSR